MYSQKDLLELIDRAQKGVIEITDLGDSVLANAKRARFIRKMQHKTVILPEARFMNMESNIEDIDRIAFVGRVLDAGDDASNDHVDLSEAAFSKPDTWTNQLIAKEFQAITSLRDKAARRSIERGNFENTLIDLFGEAAGRDMEELAIFGDKNITYNSGAGELHKQSRLLSKIDGWVKNAANAVYGVGGAKDFDPSGDDYPVDMFEAMLEATPKEYLANIDEWRIWVTWDVEQKYRRYLRNRETGLGDAALISKMGLEFEGIPIRKVPMLERARATESQGTGSVCILGYPSNMVWGIFHQVSIEREREAKKRRTDWVLSLEGDADFEDENACTVAYIQKENPES